MASNSGCLSSKDIDNFMLTNFMFGMLVKDLHLIFIFILIYYDLKKKYLLYRFIDYTNLIEQHNW